MNFDTLPLGAKAAMEPMAIEARYQLGTRCSSGGRACLPVDESHGSSLNAMLSGDGGKADDGSLCVAVSFDGEVLEVRAKASAALFLEAFKLDLRHAFSSDEMVLLNGYQSWTDTHEMSAWGRMRGLRGVPKRLVRRFALDGGGDYAFAEYSAKRGLLHGFTYASFRRGNGMVFVGSLDESHGFTMISSIASEGVVSLSTECPQRTLEPFEEIVLGRYAVTRGSVEECYDRYFELAGVAARPVKPLVGFTSWYRHYADIDEDCLLHDLQAASRFFESAKPQNMPAVTRLFQIDDGYCSVGDWLDVDSEKFPSGIEPLADRIRAEGFLPGLWLAPFVCSVESRLFREHPEWLLRDTAGNIVPTSCHWGGAYALDTRNVEVRSYVLEVLQTVTAEWGFGLLKLDFLYGACMIAHDGLNRGELMADALRLIRTGVGDETLVLGCGVPLGSAFGQVDYCRIGCDVGLDWDNKVYMRALHRERVSTKNSLGNTYGRAPLDGRAFGNDPDVFFLRSDVKLSETQRDELLFAAADLGSVLLTSDDMGTWSDGAKERYELALDIFVKRRQ